ncbi:MAG TPA: hypothetical protein PKK11_03270 [Methanothrix sp.]|nr:hypothetical protein [Methanothrix sp.]HPT19089.1 hypothetical protein [Methanothrix sp.]
MQYKSAAILCALAMPALIMAAAWGQDAGNSTMNSTINNSLNSTMNAAANLTPNTAASASLESVVEAKDTGVNIGAGRAGAVGKVLRAGFNKTKPLNDLDVYGNKPVHFIANSNNSSPKAAFNVSQRVGSVANMTYNTEYTAVYSIDEHSRTRPTYEAPDNLSSRPVYSISGYPTIKMANSIP